MNFNYCPYCSDKLILKELGDEGLISFCENCNVPYFNKFNVCVLVVVINEYNEVVLIKQDYVSHEYWLLVAGYIKKGYTAEETVINEVKEETGQTVENLNYIKSYYYPKSELLMLGFVASVKKINFNSSKEVNEIKWFDFNNSITYLKKGSTSYQHFLNVINFLEKNTIFA